VRATWHRPPVVAAKSLGERVWTDPLLIDRRQQLRDSIAYTAARFFPSQAKDPGQLAARSSGIGRAPAIIRRIG
jgi:hypothetical protein